MSQVLDEARVEMDQLVSNMKTVILSTVSSEGTPNSSYAPSIKNDKGDYFIYISSLSKHTSNLLNGSTLSMMIIDDESDSENIFARRRLTMDATPSLVDRGTDQWQEIIDMMEEQLGETIAYLKDLTDFHMFKLEPGSGLFVHGFGKAFKLSGGEFDKIEHINDTGHTKD